MSSKSCQNTNNNFAMQTLRRLPISYQLARGCCVVNSSFRRNIAFSHGSTIVSDDKDTSHTSTEGKKSSQTNTGKEEKYNNKKPSNSETSKAKKGNHKYDSLKFYREGPNPESGELDPKAGSEEVKKHNKSVTERHDKA